MKIIYGGVSPPSDSSTPSISDASEHKSRKSSTSPKSPPAPNLTVAHPLKPTPPQTHTTSNPHHINSLKPAPYPTAPRLAIFTTHHIKQQAPEPQSTTVNSKNTQSTESSAIHIRHKLGLLPANRATSSRQTNSARRAIEHVETTVERLETTPRKVLPNRYISYNSPHP